MTPTEPTVFIVDDDPAIRDALSELIATINLKVQTFSKAQDFLDNYPTGQLGCLVLDVRMPGINGLELQNQLAQRAINLPIVFLTGHGDVTMAVDAIKKGAFEFLEKPFRDQTLLDCVQRALEMDRVTRGKNTEKTAIQSRYAQLTTREKQVLQLIVKGKTSKVIGQDLGISPKTVDFHRAHIMDKMEVDTIAGLTRMAVNAELE